MLHCNNDNVCPICTYVNLFIYLIITISDGYALPHILNSDIFKIEMDVHLRWKDLHRKFDCFKRF